MAFDFRRASAAANTKAANKKRIQRAGLGGPYAKDKKNPDPLAVTRAPKHIMPARNTLAPMVGTGGGGGGDFGPKPKKKVVTRPSSAPATVHTPSPRGGISRGESPAPSSAAPRIRKAPKVNKKPKTIEVPTPPAAAPEAVTAAPEATDLLQPGFDEISRLESEASRTRGLQINDAAALRDWMAGQNTAAEDFLSKSLAASRVAMPENNLLAEAQRRAAAAVGGNADLMKASGIDASNATQAAYQHADAARGSSPELQAQAFSRGLADQRGVTSATMANVGSGIDSSFNNRLSDLANKRVDLTTESTKLGLQDKQAQAQQAQDSRMFDLIAKEKLGKLAVDKKNATTKRLQVFTTAQNASRSLELKAQIEAGRLSRSDARDAFDQELKSQNLSIVKRKLELARFDSQTKRMKANGADVSKLSDFVQKRYDNVLAQFGNVAWDAVPRDQQRKAVRNIITALRGAGGATLSQGQALAILGGVFGDIPVRDPAFQQMVTALWPR